MKTGSPVSQGSAPNGGGLFHLYVAGLGPQSVEAILKVRQEMERFHSNTSGLRVFDVHQQPELVKSMGVRALPALIRIFPQPQQRRTGVVNGADAGFWQSASLPH